MAGDLLGWGCESKGGMEQDLGEKGFGLCPKEVGGLEAGFPCWGLHRAWGLGWAKGSLVH